MTDCAAEAGHGGPCDLRPRERSLQERAFLVFGRQAQLLQLAEELNEAAAAVIRLANGKGDPWHAIEEIVDVESVVLSLKDDLGTPGTWEGIRSAKEDKLREILERVEKERAL